MLRRPPACYADGGDAGGVGGVTGLVASLRPSQALVGPLFWWVYFSYISFPLFFLAIFFFVEGNVEGRGGQGMKGGEGKGGGNRVRRAGERGGGWKEGKKRQEEGEGCGRGREERRRRRRIRGGGSRGRREQGAGSRGREHPELPLPSIPSPSLPPFPHEGESKTFSRPTGHHSSVEVPLRESLQMYRL